MNLHDSAKEELKAAVTYYEECEPGLGDELFEEVLIGFEQIRQHPNAWPTIYRDFRRYLIHRFPYALVYRVAHDELMILAVAHTSRRPGFVESVAKSRLSPADLTKENARSNHHFLRRR